MSEINLIAKKKEGLQNPRKIVKVLRKISILSLFLVFVSALIVFYLKMNSPLNDLKATEKRLISNLSSSKEKIAKIAVLNDRLTNIDGILNKRGNFNKIIEEVENNQSSNLRITALSVNKKSLLISVASPSLSSISSFIDFMLSMAENKKLFTKVTLNNIRSDKDKGYYFSLEANL